jgi:hypothetical protein
MNFKFVMRSALPDPHHVVNDAEDLVPAQSQVLATQRNGPNQKAFVFYDLPDDRNSGLFQRKPSPFPHLPEFRTRGDSATQFEALRLNPRFWRTN